jgi:hypothetical protein
MISVRFRMPRSLVPHSVPNIRRFLFAIQVEDELLIKHLV